MRKNRIHDYHSVENFKRRRALGLKDASGDAKFFERILTIRKIQELVFISKNVAKHR